MISLGVFGLQVSPRFKSRKSIFKINCICQNNSPFFSQYLLDVGPWTHCLKRGSGWLSCLLQTWRTIDFHFAKISSPNPSLVEVAHQCKWFLMALCHFTRSSHPLSFPTWSSFFDTDLAKCQMSKKCLVAGCCSLIHFAIDRCLSETNKAMVNPAALRKAKQSWHPLSSMSLLLFTWFAC